MIEQIRMMLPTSFQGDYVFYPILFNFIVLCLLGSKGLLFGLLFGFIPKFSRNNDGDDDMAPILIFQAVIVLIGFFGYAYYKDPSSCLWNDKTAGVLVAIPLICIVFAGLFFLIFLCAVMDALFLIFSFSVGFSLGWLIRKIFGGIKHRKKRDVTTS